MKSKIPLNDLYLINVRTQIPYKNSNDKMIKFVPNQLAFVQKNEREYVDVLFESTYYLFLSYRAENVRACYSLP